MTDPMGRVTHYKHHDNGLLQAVTDPEGRTTDYHWNARGELIQVTDFEGNQQLKNFLIIVQPSNR